jgi:hypothetical protein
LGETVPRHAPVPQAQLAVDDFDTREVADVDVILVDEAHNFRNRRADPETTIRGKKIAWPSRQLHTVEYDLEATYEGFYRHLIRQIEAPNLVHYSLEGHKRSKQKQDDLELGCLV